MAKLKIVQIENFYKSFTDNLYNNNQFLNNLSYDLQLRFLFNSGWSSGQNVVPYLNSSKWDSFYIIPTCIPLQFRWGVENGYALDTPLDHLLYYQLEKIKPDVIYLSDIPCFNFGILDLLEKKPIVVGWHATSLPDHIPWNKLDLLLSGISAIRNRALELGVKFVENFMSGAPNYNKIGRISNENLNDICFSGSFSASLHNERAQLFLNIAGNIGDKLFDIYTSNPFSQSNYKNLHFHPPVYASDVVEKYSSYKITLDARANFGLNEFINNRDTSNMRIFEATKAGSLLITEASNNLHEYFDIGTEIETYTNQEELIDKLNFYLNEKNENLRLSVAEKGYLRTITDHSIEKRSIWFETILKNYF